MAKPKINDSVERDDLSRMFGIIKKVVSNDVVIVEWQDGKKPKRTREKINNLALVGR